MIHPERLYNFFQEKGIQFFTGVPDSLLKHFLKYVNDHAAHTDHIITANEGLAVGLASGYHFRTGKIPLVYLQNSGLGNTINPLTSLANKEMYSVPMLLLIGWRGKPGTKDEPQHKKMGKILLYMLTILDIPFYILDTEEANSFKKIDEAIEQATKEKMPVALIAAEEIFSTYSGTPEADKFSLVREEVIKKIIAVAKGDEQVVCTTGKIGREFYEQNKLARNKISKYFLSVGAMGHANHIALGVQGNEKTIMLDGDGAMLMHLGSLATIAKQAKDNFIHIVINNGSHESVGGQSTGAFDIDSCAVAKACGYQKAFCITNDDELNNWLQNYFTDPALQFVEIKTNRFSRADLGRPSGSPVDWKENFMNAIKKKI